MTYADVNGMSMYYEEHGRPHFHARYAEHDAFDGDIVVLRVSHVREPDWLAAGDACADDDPRRVQVRTWLQSHPSPSGRELAEAGYVAPHWPAPWGLDADPIHQLIIDDELRRAAEDGNPLTSPDPDWLSLFATPGYPDHPSGYNAVSGAFMYTAAHFFGTDASGMDVLSRVMHGPRIDLTIAIAATLLSIVVVACASTPEPSRAPRPGCRSASSPPSAT